jgi:hypothetical protein
MRKENILQDMLLLDLVIHQNTDDGHLPIIHTSIGRVT